MVPTGLVPKEMERGTKDGANAKNDKSNNRWSGQSLV